MRAEIIRKKMQKTVLKQGVQISQPYILDQLVISLMIPIIELSIGGILLCRSSVIRKSIKK